MSDRQVGEQRQAIDSGLWATENVQEVLPTVTMASTGTMVSEAVAVDVRRFYGSSDQQPGFVVTNPYPSGSSRDLETRAVDDAIEEDEADGSSSSDSDNEPLAKIAKMGKVQSSPNSKNPKKPRKASGPRTPTAYSLFVREHQPVIMSKQSSARPADVLRIVRALWKGMDAKSRKPYTDAAKAAKVRMAALSHGNADGGLLSSAQELRSGSEASAAAVPESGAPAAHHLPSEVAIEKRPPALGVPPTEALGVGATSAGPSSIFPPEAVSSVTSSARSELGGTVMTMPLGSVDASAAAAAAVGSASRVLSLLKSVAPVAVTASGTAAPIAANAASRGQVAVVAAGSAAVPTDSVIPAMIGKAVKTPPSTVAPSSSPQVVHIGVPTLSLLSPVEASQLPRMPLRTAATAGRHQVVTNGGTKVIIIAQQSNGIGITQHVTQRPLRLIALGTQGAQVPAGVDLMPSASGVQPESVAPSKPSSAAFSVVALPSTSGSPSAADCGASKIGSTAASFGSNSALAGSAAPPHPVSMSVVKCDFAVAPSADATKLESEHRPMEVVSGSVGEEAAHDMDTTETTHTSNALPARTEVRRNTCLGCGRFDEDAASSGDTSTKASQGAAAGRWKYDGYCSSRCTIDHCKSVFNAWVARRRPANDK